MSAVRVALLAALVAEASVACGHDARQPPASERGSGETKGAGGSAEPAEIPAGALGLPGLIAYRWRIRAGQPAFRVAQKAEARGDWAAVVAACQQALAADPGHLDASWLLAVGLAKLGKVDQVLAPLARAAAGDFAKWGQASLELPGMAAFFATPTGAAWRRRVEQDRKRFSDAVQRSLLVTGDGELFAVEIDAGRWYRLTRHTGAVIGALAVPAAQRVAYIARTRRKGAHELAVGMVDVAGAKTWRPMALGTAGPISVAYSARPPSGVWIGAGGPRAMAWRQLDDEYRLRSLPARSQRPGGPWLEVTARASVHLHALPPDVTADWDDQSLASAIRIGTSNRVISLPSPGLIDGNTAAWSPDRVHLAFVAQLDEHCAPGAINTAAMVADASTGATRELARAASGIAIAWLGERRLAIAGDGGVAIHSLDEGAAPIVIEGATGLVIPRERPRCAAPEPPEPASDDGEPAEPASGEDPADAGVPDPR